MAKGKHKLPKRILAKFREWGRQGGVARKEKIGPDRCREIAELARSKIKHSTR